MEVENAQEKWEYCEGKKTGQCDGKWDRKGITLDWADGQGVSEVTMLKLRPEWWGAKQAKIKEQSGQVDQMDYKCKGRKLGTKEQKEGFYARGDMSKRESCVLWKQRGWQKQII